MKVMGQDKDGRIIIDGEGEVVHIKKAIPGDSPAFLTNFTFIDTQATIDVSFGRIEVVMENLKEVAMELQSTSFVHVVATDRLISTVDCLDSHLSELREILRNKKPLVMI